MREFKFRAWDICAKKMLPQEVLYWDRDKFITGVWDYEELYIADRENDNLIIMQYIGLKDDTKWEELAQDEQEKWLNSGKTKNEWNGKEIYERDIVRVKFTQDYSNNHFTAEEGDEMVGQIVFEDAMFLIKFPNNTHIFCAEIIWEEIEVKVIGNIYENPQLLEREKEVTG